VPTTFLPPLDASNQPEASGGQLITPRLGMLLAALERCRSIVDDQANPAVERFLAKGILRMGHFIAGSPAPESIHTHGQSIETLNSEYIILQSGQSVKMSLLAPPSVLANSPITSVGTLLSNSGGTGDGILTVEICVGNICRSGQRPLAESSDGEVFKIPLDQPLAPPADAPLRLTFTHQNGSYPVALRLTPAAAAAGRPIQGLNGTPPDPSLQLALEYGMALPGLRKVYADSVMDIWELPNPAPYFQVIQGGPCSFLTTQRENVTAECVAPATLLRRELYMPGWRVTVNGAATAVQQDDIFQSAALPAGHVQVRYHFAPAYVEFGWAASVIGTLGLIWQVIRLGLSRQLHL